MTYEENVRAILESNFAGFKEEIIDAACKSINGLSTKGRWEWKFDEKTGIRGMHCSECGYAEAQVYKKFCGQCGADMREEIGGSNDKPDDKDKPPKEYATKLVPIGFSQHDCESHYKCPFCEEHYGSWSIPINKPFKCKCGKYVWTD